MLTGNHFQYYRTINKFWFYCSSKSLQWCLNQQVILEFRYHYDSIILGTGRRIIIILIWIGIFLCARVRECQSCCIIRAGGRFDVVRNIILDVDYWCQKTDFIKLFMFIFCSFDRLIIIDQSEWFRIPQITFAVIKSCLRFDSRKLWKNTWLTPIK